VNYSQKPYDSTDEQLKPVNPDEPPKNSTPNQD